MQNSNNFQLAADFINYTHRSIFLTGNAGTGKTTFLKHCKENGIKNTAIVAPTGVAAMNAGGTTIHSFFQLPFTPFLPVGNGFKNDNGHYDKSSLINRLRLTTERREVMQQLELLIIDEISMVRSDVLDAIDTVLRHVRKQYSSPFGGVQLLLIGDMFQLPPVVKEEEWLILSSYYKSQYFFNSYAIESFAPVYVELDKIYRQSDPAFVEVLNKVRNNEMDTAGFDLLHTRYHPNFNPPKSENFILLTTHNHKAEAINMKALHELEGEIKTFNAIIEGDFFEKSFPADMELKLKLGAQVMFIKNDTEKVRRYFNGKIGVVVKIEEDKIQVACKGDNNIIEVKKERWKNIRYTVDKTTNLVEEVEIGSFTQFPLRLAWAITIHKSQGLTFEKAIIDAGDAFAPGQVYVALSRCTSLEGLVLRSRITQNSLQNDSRIIDFTATRKKSAIQFQLLQQAKFEFQKDILLNLFDFGEQQLNTKALLSFVMSQQTSFNIAAISWLEKIQLSISNLDAIAKKFSTQLLHLLTQVELPEKNEALQQRLMAASRHFTPELDKIKKDMNLCPAETDSKLVAGDFTTLLQDLYNGICLRLHLIVSCKNGFILEDFLHQKRCFTRPVLSVNAFTGKTKQERGSCPHPELLGLLCKKRDELSREKKVPLYMIGSSASLEEMVIYLPQTPEALSQVWGFGPVKINKYGDTFLSIIREYCNLHQLTSSIESKPAKLPQKERRAAIKTETKLASFNMYKEGKTIEAIAIERQLSMTTIEEHLAYFIGIGEIDINAFVTPGKQQLVKEAITNHGMVSTKILKENLPEEISYGDIKMMLASLRAAG